jgi:hypothetical protein
LVIVHGFFLGDIGDKRDIGDVGDVLVYNLGLMARGIKLKKKSLF